MKIFSIYKKRKENSQDIRIVKSGLCFFAGIFNLFWALYHKMWSIVIPLIIAQVLLKHYGYEYALDIFQFIEIIAFLILGEELQRYNLKCKGFEEVDVIYATSVEEAEYKFIQRNLQNV